VGGTSQTVAMQRGELYPLFMHVDEVIAAREPGVVVEITTPRRSDPVRVCPVGDVHYWGENLDGGRTESAAIAALKKPQLRDLLRDPCIPARLEAINRDLPPAADNGQGKESGIWLRADMESISGKNAYIRLCRLVMAASVLVSLSISQQEWQAIGLLVVLVAVVLFPRLQKGPKQTFIQWRCLAESLRVTDIWAAVGVEVDTADLFHSQTNQNFAWIRTVLRARRLQLLAAHTRSGMRPPLPEAITRCGDWIRGQANWLNGAMERQRREDQRLTALAAGSFLLALTLAIAYWLGLDTIPGVLPEFLIGLTAVCLGYRELIGYSDTNARYGRSRAQFTRAALALDCAQPDPHDPASLDARRRLVMEAIGREKIDELNDWVGDQLQRVYRPGG
jgi:hypothetical protein